MSRRILLADDSVTIQKVIELTFMDEDYEVTAVSNGDEAVALLDQLRPDFVIADVHMPGANGYEVCRRAKAALPGVPVLLLVGTFEPFDEGLSRSVGADAFLKKPFDSQELLQLVEQLLGGAPRPAQAAPAEPAAAAAPIPDPFAAVPSAGAEELPGLGDPEAEAVWGNFEAESDTAPPPLDSGAWPAATPAWEADAPAEEQVFELDAEAVDLTLGDDSLLPGEAEPFRFGGGERLEPAGGLEALPSDEAPFRFDPAPETAQPFAAEEPFRFAEAAAVPAPAEPEEPFGFGGAPVGWSGTDEAPIAETGGAGVPAAPGPEERLGVPAGAVPLASGLDEVERRVHEHEAAPAFRSTAPLPPAEDALTSRPAAAAAPAFAASAAAAPSAGVGATGALGRLSDEDVDRIARRLLELAGEKVVRDVAWEVVPDMAELVIKDRLRELEAQVE